MVRRAYLIMDVQFVLFKFLEKLTTVSAPWTSWTTVLGWPEKVNFDAATKPLIYISTPMVVNDRVINHAGGLSRFELSTIIGSWCTLESGGMYEASRISSAMIELFSNPQTIYSKQFTVTLGATTYTNTRLTTMGVRVKSITGPVEIPDPDSLDFRQEITLNCNVGGS